MVTPNVELIETLLATGRPPDAIAVALADRQGGVVGAEQLALAGLSASAMTRRVRAGRLTRITRGVYAVGRLRLDPLGWLWAAVLATGGVVSHASAGWRHGWLEGAPTHVHVVTTGGGRSRGRIVVHRSRTLVAEDVVHLDGLPVTSVARTLVTLGPRLTARGVREAEHRRVFDLVAVEAVLERVPSRPLRVALANPFLVGDDGVRSGGEHDLLDLLAAAHVPAPRVNDLVHGLRVDLHWPDRRLVVELDSRRWHGTALAMEEDRRRDARLVAAGYRVLRFTWTQVAHEPATVIRALTTALA